MPVRTRSAGASDDARMPNRVARSDNRLAPLDQSFFTWQQATGEKVAIQIVWVYEHQVDFDGLRRFHRNLGRGLLGRRIERSTLPFARHRWVADPAPSEIDIAECPRPRSELSDWADERSQLPTDPEWGPGWHLGVQPLDDGATAISLVVSHCLVDGLGLAVVILDAIMGKTRDLGLPPPHSRTPLRAAVHDVRETAQDTPHLIEAFMAGSKLAGRRWRDRTRPARPEDVRSPAAPVVPLRGGDADEVIVVPGITIYTDLDDWDARAKALGGTSNTLLAGLAAKLAERMGRRRAADGAVTLQLPISERGEDDTRANAMSIARVGIDPAWVTKDLRPARDAIKQALAMKAQTPDEVRKLLWLMPFRSRRSMERAAEAAHADPDCPVYCSYLGDLTSLLCHIDGTDAEYITARATWHNATRQWLERTGGVMRLQSGRINGRITVTVVAYQPGAENTKPALRELAAQALADFDLTGEID